MIALDSFLSWVPNLKIEMISSPLTTLDVIQSLLSVPILRLSASLLPPLSVCSMLISLTQLLILTVTKLSAQSNRLIEKQLPSSSHYRSSYPPTSSSTSRSIVPTVSILRAHPLSTLIPFLMSHSIVSSLNSTRIRPKLWYCVFNQTHRRTTSYSCIQAEFEHPPRFKGLHRCQSRIQSPPSRQ
jgi:hypothetical protein